MACSTNKGGGFMQNVFSVLVNNLVYGNVFMEDSSVKGFT